MRVDNFEFSNYTAVENLNQIDLTIYPKPANETLSIHIPPTSENLFVAVFDFSGQAKLKSFMPANEFRLSTKNFAPGLYFLQITGNDNRPVGGRTFEVQR